MKSIITAAVLASALVAAPAMADLDLAKKSGCLACHSVDKKVVGPAWKDVAASGADRARLITTITKGGKGNWTAVTGGVPMPPYSPRVSDANIEILADFILGL
ncbi:MAG: c-type cytochrome [Gammaproteobacteria bacterium]|nr:c-type cytochrome [Gammaproteobacteria bacterium]